MIFSRMLNKKIYSPPREKIFNFLKLWILLFRLNRPIGGLYLFIPCMWGYLLSHNSDFLLSEGILLFFASFWARGLGCAFNDWADREIDGKISRTACRPFPKKMVTMASFWWVFSFLLAMGSLLLLLFLPLKVLLCGFFWGILVFLYPFCKRWTYYPQIILGLCFNSGVFLGTLGNFPSSFNSWLIFGLVYLWGISWTLDYDTVYSFQDRSQDKEAGIFSLGLKLTSLEDTFLILCKLFRWTISMVLLAILPMKHPLFYFIIVTIGTVLSFFYQIKLNIFNPSSCHRYFTRQILWEGLFFTLGLWVSNLSISNLG